MVEKKGFSKISPNELHGMINKHDGFVLIDVLPNDHFNMGHLPGAKNACVFEVVFLDNVTKIVSNKDEEIVVYGSTRFFEHLGMHLVFDLISIQLYIVARGKG